MSFAEFVRQAKEGDEQEWLVAGLVPKGGYTVLGGDPKTGKTLLAFDLGFAVASGRPFLGREVVPAAFLYVSEEGTKYEIAKRAERLLAHDEPEDPQERPAKVLWREGIRFDDRDTWDWVRDELAELDQPTLLVLDPLRDLLAGDENDSAAIAAVNRAVAGVLRDFSDVSVLLIHHLSKTRRQGAAGIRLRGSGALWGSVDGTLLLSADDVPGDAVGEVALHGKLVTEPRNDARAVIRWEWDPVTGLFSETEGGTAAERAEDFLAANGSALVADIAEAVGTTKHAMRTILGRHHERFSSRPGEPGQPSVWGLPGWDEEQWERRNTPTPGGNASVAPPAGDRNTSVAPTSTQPDSPRGLEDRNTPVAAPVAPVPETSAADRNTANGTPEARNTQAHGGVAAAPPSQDMPVEEDYPASAYDTAEDQ